MRKFLLVVVALLVAVIFGIWWLLADANRFKPELIDLIRAKSGLVVDIRGDLSWRWWPPVQLVAHDVDADWTTDAHEPMLAARTLRLDADLFALLSHNPKLIIEGVAVDGLRAKLVQHGEHANWMPPNRSSGESQPVLPPLPIPLPIASPAAPWEVASFVMSDAIIDYVVDDDATQIRIDALHLSDIAPTRRIPLHAKLLVKQRNQETPLTVAAQLTFDELVTQWHVDALDIAGLFGRAPFHLTGNAQLKTGAPKVHVDFDLILDRFNVPSSKTAVAALGAGSFVLIAFAAPPIAIDPSLDEPILPLELIRSVDWRGKLTIAQLLDDGAIFESATVQSGNNSGAIDALFELPRFFSGSATTRLTINAAATPPQWKAEPKLTHVDSKALLAWLNGNYDWAAAFQAGGDFSMRGNTERELIASLAGHATFDGGEGIIGIKEIKDASLAIARVIGGTERVSAWPDRLSYKRFAGTWDTHGAEQSFDVALDNLALKGTGKVDPLTNALDLRVTGTVDDKSPYQSFNVGKTLAGLPLPMRCKGSLAGPKCGADADATRRLVAGALSGSDPEMTKKLDKAIDEEVPEQYRDAARSLLDLLKKNPTLKSP